MRQGMPAHIRSIRMDGFLNQALQAALDVIKSCFHYYNYTGMDNDRKESGFLEISHTADWAISVWAPDLEGLLVESARGMYALMHFQIQGEPRFERYFELQSEDAEEMLVSFLGELLHYAEYENICFDQIILRIQEYHLKANLTGSSIIKQHKEIKAVTYHNLRIKKIHDRLEATIVFDV
jgi:SHS2 domain-containing protein